MCFPCQNDFEERGNQRANAPETPASSPTGEGPAQADGGRSARMDAAQDKRRVHERSFKSFVECY